MMIILADSEREYVDILIEQLTACLPDDQFYGCCSMAEWADLPVPESRRALCLFNPVDFPDLPRESSRLNTLPGCTFWSVRPGFPEPVSAEASDSIQDLCRLIPVSTLARHLRRWINTGSSADGSRANQSNLSGHQIYLLLSVESSGYRPEFSRLRLRELTGTGCKVIYLPIMPTYQMHCLSPPSHGPNMSDLLLRILGQNVNQDDLGQYLQPNPDGYLQFRPPDRSDDLVLCNPDILRQMVVLLRERISRENDPCSVLIDCAGIPLASVASIAVLCDSCEICLPDKECFATLAARREASYLLALLPPDCHVRENSQMNIKPESLPIYRSLTS